MPSVRKTRHRANFWPCQSDDRSLAGERGPPMVCRRSGLMRSPCTAGRAVHRPLSGSNVRSPTYPATPGARMVATHTAFPARPSSRPHACPAASRRYERRRPKKTPLGKNLTAAGLGETPRTSQTPPRSRGVGFRPPLSGPGQPWDAGATRSRAAHQPGEACGSGICWVILQARTRPL
jgi:hypothetical protein